MNRLAILTPPGTSAIAVIAASGPSCWEVATKLFRPHRGKPLPESGPWPAFWFGKFGDPVADEVILVRKSSDEMEIHCHGGRLVKAAIRRQLEDHGFREIDWREWPSPFVDPVAAAILPFARTFRTASILLDQAQGAFQRATEDLETHGKTLMRNSHVGRHLVEPWKIAIAGAPNAGKSTLLNALAGYTRSIVSPIPGTTRDAVSVSLAFDGWPIDMIDTAGQRESNDEIEAEGIRRAVAAMNEADLCLWVVDATSPVDLPASSRNQIVVLNKCDLIDVDASLYPVAVRISAANGQGLVDLIDRIVKRLVPQAPAPGEAVPYTSELCSRFQQVA